jgi:hypothetical protein
MFNKHRILGEPRVDFGDDLAGEIVFSVVILVAFTLVFLEVEGEWVGCFAVGVEGVDEVLVPHNVIFGVIVEMSEAGDINSESDRSLIERG